MEDGEVVPLVFQEPDLRIDLKVEPIWTGGPVSARKESLRDSVAERYFPGRNGAASPYRFELVIDPEVWFLEDEGFDLAVFHSHPASPPRPSRTDVESIGLWEGRPYVILSLRTGELAGWRIADGRVESLPLS